ncbi:MAG: sialidase family protein [Sorangiineae bacterium]|nr:sialidase family protein [Polyangiaceae bacterium]MEB2325128.1 sialidase family protein [Sorangiineae bacterium]
MMKSHPDDSERPRALPPLDDGDDGDGPLESGPELATPDALETGLDDELASGLDIGLMLEAPELAPGGDGDELVLDLAAMFEAAAERDEASDDALGPERFDVTTGLGRLGEEPLGSEDRRGPEGPLDDLLDEELPDLDDDGAGEVGELADASWLALPDEADPHEPPPWASERWPMTLLHADAGAVASLGESAGLIVAGGDSLLALPEGGDEPRPLALAGGRVASVAPLDGGRSILYANDLGEVWRLRPTTGVRERLLAVPRATMGGPLELCHAGAVVIARSSDGWLSSTADGGDTWTPIDVRARVLALSSGAPSLVGVARERARRLLLRSDDGGASWQPLALASVAEPIAGSEGLLVAARDHVIALAAPNVGLAISADHGATFTRLPGTTGVTALTIGERSGKLEVFAAVLAELAGATHILSVDPLTATAQIVAALEGEAGDEAALEQVRVDALLWDAARARLVAGGGAGLCAWQPLALRAA